MYGKTKILDKCDKYFNRTKYNFICENCNTVHQKEYRYKDKQHRCSSFRDNNGQKEKWCFKCKEWKITALFNKAIHTHGGFSKSCKKCWSGYMKIAEKKRRVKVMSRTMSRRIASATVAAAKHRAKKKGISFDITPEYILDMFNQQKGLCYFSNIAMRREEGLQIYSPSLDRLDPKKGYIEGNVAWVIYGVNSFKQGLDKSEFIQLIRSISWREEHNG